MLQEVDITEAGENNPEDFKIVVIGDGAVGRPEDMSTYTMQFLTYLFHIFRGRG